MEGDDQGEPLQAAGDLEEELYPFDSDIPQPLMPNLPQASLPDWTGRYVTGTQVKMKIWSSSSVNLI